MQVIGFHTDTRSVICVVSLQLQPLLSCRQIRFSAPISEQYHTYRCLGSYAHSFRLMTCFLPMLILTLPNSTERMAKPSPVIPRKTSRSFKVSGWICVGCRYDGVITTAPVTPVWQPLAAYNIDSLHMMMCILKESGHHYELKTLWIRYRRKQLGSPIPRSRGQPSALLRRCLCAHATAT